MPSPSWSFTGSLPNTPRRDIPCVILQNGKALIAGGDGSSPTNTVSTLYDPGTGIWTDTGSLNTARSNAPAIVLQNGKVLIAGGGDAVGPITSCELYDPGTGLWTPTGSLNTARSIAILILLNDGTVLLAGGFFSGGNATATAEIYDPVAATWSFTTGPLNQSRASYGAVKLNNGKVLFAGGESPVHSPLSSSELYDPVTKTFSFTGSLSSTHTADESVNNLCCLLNDGTVLLASGNSSTTSEVYDPVAGTWGHTATLSSVHFGTTPQVLRDGKVILPGGADISGLSTTVVDLYNPDTVSWTPTASLNTSRANFGIATLSNGTVIVVGGVNSHVPVDLSSAELYNYPFINDHWIATTGQLNVARGGGSSLVKLNNGKILLIGGENSTFTDTLTSCELFDPIAQTWSVTGSLIQKKRLAGAVLLTIGPNAGKVLSIGGLAGSPLSDCEIYDPTAGTWSSTGSMANPRWGFASFTLPSGKILVVCGVGATGQCEIYDPVAGTWSTAAAYPQGNMFTFMGFATLNDGRPIVIGGASVIGGSFANVNIYNEGSDTWAAQTSYPLIVEDQGIANFVITLLSGKVLVVGGFDATSTYYTACNIFDPVANTWSVAASLPFTAKVPGALYLLVDGTVLCAGGYDGASLSDSEIYDPVANTWTPTGSLLEASFLGNSSQPQGIVLNNPSYPLWAGQGVSPFTRSEVFQTPILSIFLSDSITMSDSQTEALAIPLADSISLTDTFPNSFSVESNAVTPVNIPIVENLVNQLVPADVKTYFKIEE